MKRVRFRPPTVRETVVQLPNGFTLANLFFGIWAIVNASKGNFNLAVWCIVLGGIADALDGRVARAVGASGPFGEELDSLVDAITFGLAPGMIVYFAVLRHDGWDWIFTFLFTACAVIRLARFNVTQAGSSKTHFIGLPSPAAGGTLATYFWFSQTNLYRETVIGDLPWQFVLRGLMALLAFLMISNVPYPAWPRFSMRTWRGRLGIIVLLSMVLGLIFLPREFIFPLAIGYIAWGIVAAVVVGLTAETPDEDFLGDEPPEPGEPLVAPAAATPMRRPTPRHEPVVRVDAARDDGGEDAEAGEDDQQAPRRRRKRRRGGAGRRPGDGPRADTTLDGPNE
jgi:CDP-diacylglycerol--serine O-phosphatidyltransferase